MTNSSLAQSYLAKATRRLKILPILLAEQAYSDVIREAQELVELALKGMLRQVGVEPIVGPYDQLEIARVQRFSINKDIPSTQLYEIGNPQAAGTSLDTPNVTLTFSVFDVGIRAFAVMTGNDPVSYPAAGVDISDLQEVDAIVFVKDATPFLIM